MKKIKVSHEVPFCLLKKSREFNDYDYCLPHLMDENEEYKNFFYKSKEMGRYIVMDNSLHELGEAYNTDRLLYWINEIKPNEFIVPDVWEDKDTSVRNAKLWSQVELPDGVMKVAVVQAKSYHEAMLCTQAYKDFGYKKIAYSYGASYYNEMCPHPNKDLGKAIGRFMVISQLLKDKILTHTDRVHLVMAAIGEMPYTNMGLSSKPIANMNKYQDISLEFVNEDLVEYNVEMFRKINGL